MSEALYTGVDAEFGKGPTIDFTKLQESRMQGQEEICLTEKILEI